MKHLAISITALALFCGCVYAESDVEETELLQSWGLKADAQGRLVFVTTSPAHEYQHWQADMSAYQPHQAQTPVEALIPLVIGSHDQYQSNE